MKDIIDEYGSMVLGVTGLLLFFGTMSAVLLSGNGVLVQMIQTWLLGGVSAEGDYGTIWAMRDRSIDRNPASCNYWRHICG